MAARATWAASSTAEMIAVHDGIDDLADDCENSVIADVFEVQGNNLKMLGRILQGQRKARVIRAF